MLSVRGVSKSYTGPGGPLPVLEGIDLTVEAGGFVSLLGPSGGGKSTLLNILAGLEPPDAGTVQTALPPAYMQQKDLLLPWRTVLDNALLAPELAGRGAAARNEAMALLEDFGLAEFAGAWPAQLSGGMRQRVALARTLLARRGLLLLDEPFGALDAITRRRLQGLLLQVWRRYGLTILLVTHDVDEALRLSERVVLLGGQPGRIRHAFDIATPLEERAASTEVLRLKNTILDELETLSPAGVEGTAAPAQAAGGAHG